MKITDFWAGSFAAMPHHRPAFEECAVLFLQSIRMTQCSSQTILAPTRFVRCILSLRTPAYAPIWPEGYPDLQSRRDSQVYNLLQQEAARADKIREENRQIAAERADLQNNDKHKGRSTKMWHLFVASFYLGYLSYLWLAYVLVVALILQGLSVVGVPMHASTIGTSTSLLYACGCWYMCAGYTVYV